MDNPDITPSDPTDFEVTARCPKCYSVNVKQLSLYYISYECADCRLIFDTTNSNDYTPGYDGNDESEDQL